MHHGISSKTSLIYDEEEPQNQSVSDEKDIKERLTRYQEKLYEAEQRRQQLYDKGRERIQIQSNYM